VLALAGCGDDEQTQPPPGPPEPLETVDLCGPDDDTRALVRTHLAAGGVPGVTAWLRDRLRLPARIRTCSPVRPEPTLHTRVVRVAVARVTPEGTNLGTALELGTPLRQLPLGVRETPFVVYPEDAADPEAEGVRLTVVDAP
jgi:hypothetical protein